MDNFIENSLKIRSQKDY